MSASLNGKRIVVLGGTSGIGLATAKAAQREGAMIVVASSRQQRVDHALTSLESGAEGHVVDFSDEAQVRRFFGNIGAFDHLVYTAGETLQLETLDTVRLDRATHEITLLTANRTFRQLDMPRQPQEPAPEATLKRGNESVVAGLQGVEWSWTEDVETRTVCITAGWRAASVSRRQQDGFRGAFGKLSSSTG
jgi:NAD(P)-dependent dehydrogenase (short-subunit alcohol dehydrogenase family)